MIALIRELRRKAALCRRAASISTSGSGRTDPILLALAEQLEREVALVEQLVEPLRRRRPSESDNHKTARCRLSEPPPPPRAARAIGRYQVFGRNDQAGQLGGAHLAGMTTAAPSSKLYDTLAEAVSATNARNARSLHRTRRRWVAVAAEGGGFTVRWLDRPGSRPRFPAQSVT